MVSIRPCISSMVGSPRHRFLTRDFVNNVLAGEFPGPTIEARTGDQLNIIVLNQLDNGEGVAFHWHGLHMKGSHPR
jgi:FtsP/CotA-like multicopper oxidase with cupredoxin domain